MPSVLILGTDAFLAAQPATAAQLVGACGVAGFAATIPTVWGDEVVADATLRHLARRPDEPAILCACPHVAERLLNHGGSLDRFLVPVEAPPVAAARYLRAMYGSTTIHITYVGGCPAAAVHADIDAHLTPSELLGLLADRGIRLSAQEEGGTSAPVHRRFRSQPGGAPTAQALWAQHRRTFVELGAVDFSSELAQRMIARERALFDLAPRLGCVCSGAVNGGSPSLARDAVMATEPTRARGEVLDPRLRVVVERTLTTLALPQPLSTPPESHPAYLNSASHTDSRAVESDTGTIAAPRRPPRVSGVMRAVAAGRLPVTRSSAGQALPRAYAGVRHRSLTSVPAADKAERPPTQDREREVPLPSALFADSGYRRQTPPSVTVPFPIGEAYRVPGPPSINRNRLHAATFLAVIAAVVAVAVFVLS